MEGIRLRLIIGCLMERLYHRRHQRFCDIADAKPQDPLSGMSLLIGSDALCDIRKEIGIFQITVMCIEYAHCLSPISTSPSNAKHAGPRMKMRPSSSTVISSTPPSSLSAAGAPA